MVEVVVAAVGVGAVAAITNIKTILSGPLKAPKTVG